MPLLLLKVGILMKKRYNLGNRSDMKRFTKDLEKEIKEAAIKDAMSRTYEVICPTCALYHDVGEVIIGDLPTPVKYFNPEIKDSYSTIEDIAKDKLLSMLPADLHAQYRPYMSPDKRSKSYQLVKAADKLSAYIKCLEETSVGNGEFLLAERTIRQELEQYMNIPAVRWFMTDCVPAFKKTLDELG